MCIRDSTNILRDVGEDLTKNRTYIPQHLIKKYLVNKSLNMKVYSKEFFLMCEEFSCRAHSKYHEAFLSLPKREYQRQRPGIVMGIIYRSLLENIEKSNYQVLTRRIRLSPLQKFWAAWRASWGTIPKRATL